MSRPGLVGVVSVGEVLADQRQRVARIEVEGDAGERRARLLRLLLEVRDPAVRVDLDRVVAAADELEIAHVVDGEQRCATLPRDTSEVAERLREEVVSRHDDEVVVDALTLDDEADVADRAEPVVVARRPVVDDGHVLALRPTHGTGLQSARS